MRLPVETPAGRVYRRSLRSSLPLSPWQMISHRRHAVITMTHVMVVVRRVIIEETNRRHNVPDE